MNVNSVIIISKSDFINTQIAIEFLKHLITHTNADSCFEWKLLLMNNHENYETIKFVKLINKNHIFSIFWFCILYIACSFL